MKDKKTKKELTAQYKERETIGGIYAIRNTLSNKLLLGATADLRSVENRFEFSMKTGSCVDPKLQSDRNLHGCDCFVFEVLEELRKGKTQTAKEYKADIDVLKEMWLEKLSQRNLY